MKHSFGIFHSMLNGVSVVEVVMATNTKEESDITSGTLLSPFICTADDHMHPQSAAFFLHNIAVLKSRMLQVKKRAVRLDWVRS